MNRWVLLTVLLYGLLLAVLLPALLFAGFCRWWPGMIGDHQDVTLTQAIACYKVWITWAVLGLLVLGQLLMLLVPLDIARARLPGRRKLLVPILTTAFLLANLVLGLTGVVLCVLFGDRGIDLVLGHATPLFILVVFWVFWAWLFWKYSRTDKPEKLMHRMMNFLLKGSILEFLVAVPSHIYVRQRDVCCASAGTFWGIAMGLSIMLLSFGPGVFYLYVKRFEQLRPGAAGTVADQLGHAD